MWAVQVEDGAMTDKLWKAVERKICRAFGGQRRGPTGRDQSDCVHDWLSIEIKSRASAPDYIEGWMVQAEDNAEPGQLPIVVWHRKGGKYTDDLILMRASDFLDWLGDSKSERGGNNGSG